MERVLRRIVELQQRDKLQHVIFESRGAQEDGTLELEFHRIVQNGANWGYKRPNFRALSWQMLNRPKAVNSTGLQLADLAARPIGLNVLRPNQLNRAFEVLRPKIRALKVFP
jgi:hypothetical protein